MLVCYEMTLANSAMFMKMFQTERDSLKLQCQTLQGEFERHNQAQVSRCCVQCCQIIK